MILTWQPFALAVQLLLTFFLPPIAMGERNVFLADLFCMAWCAFGVFSSWRQFRGEFRPVLRFTAAFGALFALIYAHGYFRPSLERAVYDNALYVMKGGDAFLPGRELVVALRFFAWLVAARLVGFWFGRVSEPSLSVGLRMVRATVAFCIAIAGCLLLADSANPSIRQALARIYKFSTEQQWWQGRACGVFQSPVEAGITMAWGGLLLALPRNSSALFRALGWFAVVVGVFSTKTATALVAVVLVLAIWGAVRAKQRLAPALWWPLAVGVVAVTAYWVQLKFHSESGGIIQEKFGDFRYRFFLARQYWQAAAGRFDYLVLGFGFVPYHSDNSVMFLFVRGGFVLTLVSLGYAAFKALEHGLRWTLRERCLILFFAAVAMMFDAVVYRHVIALWLGLAIPILASAQLLNRE